VPNALVALCLNTFGLQRVRETQVLQALIPVFSSRRYMRAVAGDAPRVLGSGLEELFR
jgi:sRNA-binding protein